MVKPLLFFPVLSPTPPLSLTKQLPLPTVTMHLWTWQSESSVLRCSGMYEHSSFILMTAPSRGYGWTKRKCPYLRETREPWRRTRGYTPARSVCDPEGVSWSQWGKVAVLAGLLGRVLNAERSVSGFSVMRGLTNNVCVCSSFIIICLHQPRPHYFPHHKAEWVSVNVGCAL